jgi:hypothetical protein
VRHSEGGNGGDDWRGGKGNDTQGGARLTQLGGRTHSSAFHRRQRRERKVAVEAVLATGPQLCPYALELTASTATTYFCSFG